MEILKLCTPTPTRNPGHAPSFNVQLLKQFTEMFLKITTTFKLNRNFDVQLLKQFTAMLLKNITTLIGNNKEVSMFIVTVIETFYCTTVENHNHSTPWFSVK